MHAVDMRPAPSLKQSLNEHSYKMNQVLRLPAQNNWSVLFNPLSAELNPIRHLLALVGARHIVHVSRLRVKSL